MTGLTLTAPGNLASAQVATSARLFAIDAIRGIALILMGLDHAAYFARTGVQAEHYAGVAPDFSTWPHWVSGLITNIATPTFWFVSGISIALYIAGQQRRQVPEWQISRYLLIRGAFLLLLDFTIIGWTWGYSFNILSSLAVSISLMSFIRLLPRPVVLTLFLALLVGYQGLLTILSVYLEPKFNLWQAMWLVNSAETYPAVVFPILGWIGLMGLGFVVGQSISQPVFQSALTWAGFGGVLLAIWTIIRFNGGYGNFVPYQTGEPWYYFFFMSKAPPSLDYLIFNLGLALIGLSLLINYSEWLKLNPLSLVVATGQASLFFYVAHIVVYRYLGEASLILLPIPGLIRGYIVWVVGLALLIPLSIAYRKVRKKYPKSILQYL